MSPLTAFFYLLLALAGFGLFTYLSYKFMVYIFKNLNKNN